MVWGPAAAAAACLPTPLACSACLPAGLLLLPSSCSPPPTRPSSSLHPAGDPGRLVSFEWLQGWADGGVEAGEPAPIDNSPLLCPHHKLDPAKLPGKQRGD